MSVTTTKRETDEIGESADGVKLDTTPMPMRLEREPAIGEICHDRSGLQRIPGPRGPWRGS